MCKIETVEGYKAEISISDFRYMLPFLGMSAGPARVAVRPRRVRSYAEANLDMIAASIAKATYVGGHMEYTVKTQFGQLFAVSGNVDEPLAVGRRVGLSFSGSGPVLLLAG